MLIRLEDPRGIDGLCEHFARSGFSIERAGGGMADVGRPDAPTPDQERREIVAHLRVWELLNPANPGAVVLR